MAKHIKKGSGGKREGAGRKTDAVKPITMRVTQSEKDLILKRRNKKLK